VTPVHSSTVLYVKPLAIRINESRELRHVMVVLVETAVKRKLDSSTLTIRVLYHSTLCGRYTFLQYQYTKALIKRGKREIGRAYNIPLKGPVDQTLCLNPV